MQENDKELPNHFSDDPSKNINIENEILKLKLQAETGAFFGSSENLPPEVENNFLKQVQQFEDAWRDVKTVKLYNFIGNPSYKSDTELNDEEIKTELERLMELMENHNISLAVLGQYEQRLIYRFITEELFQHEINDMQLPGWATNFTYEEFHPNHKMDIERHAKDFLKHWFEMEFNEYSSELAYDFLLADGSTLSREEVLQKMDKIFDSYTSFSNHNYAILDIAFKWDDKNQTGLGHAEGGVKYVAELENGETVNIEGPFKIYLSNEHGWWNIFYFVFPGFTW